MSITISPAHSGASDDNCVTRSNSWHWWFALRRVILGLVIWLDCFSNEFFSFDVIAICLLSLSSDQVQIGEESNLKLVCSDQMLDDDCVHWLFFFFLFCSLWQNFYVSLSLSLSLSLSHIHTHSHVCASAHTHTHPHTHTHQHTHTHSLSMYPPLSLFGVFCFCSGALSCDTHVLSLQLCQTPLIGDYAL